MIKYVIFDLGGVLIDLDMKRCLDSFRALGADPEVLLQSAASATDGGRGKATLCDGLVANGVMDLYQTGDVTTADFVEEIRRVCKPGTAEIQVLEAWNDCLLSIPAYKLEFIEQLKGMGYSTCLLSNTNDAHWQYIAAEHFGGKAERYFDHLFLSQEMHMAKPNADIFLSVLKQLGAEPQECLFLDDAQANVDAARELGYHVYKVPLKYDFCNDVTDILEHNK